VHPARNGPSAGQGFRRVPVAAQARPPRGEAAQEAAPRRLTATSTLRVGFAGTPAFAALALEAIVRRGFRIPLVLTQPDRPFGRGLAQKPSAVKTVAVAHGLPIAQPPALKSDAAQQALRDAALDVLVVAAYGLILPQSVLDLPRHGGLNIHASLLPRWRGAAPIARAIEAGDTETGITIMRMDAGLDTGPIVAMRALAIEPRDTAASLEVRLTDLGATMIVDALDALARDGVLPSTPQPAIGATYAAKIRAADAAIDWSNDAHSLDRQVRAVSPSPGAAFAWRGKPVKVRGAVPLEDPASATPGAVIALGARGIDVACGAGVLRLTEVQPAGGRTMPAQAFALGHRVQAGDRFDNGT
jgi:methionyl-tRNA formyltransferase